jgi:hypothetical protein
MMAELGGYKTITGKPKWKERGKVLQVIQGKEGGNTTDNKREKRKEKQGV